MHAHFTFGHHSLPTEGQELLLKAQDLIILSLRSILIHLHLFFNNHVLRGNSEVGEISHRYFRGEKEQMDHLVSRNTISCCENSGNYYPVRTLAVTKYFSGIHLNLKRR